MNFTDIVGNARLQFTGFDRGARTPVFWRVLPNMRTMISRQGAQHGCFPHCFSGCFLGGPFGEPRLHRLQMPAARPLTARNHRLLLLTRSPGRGRNPAVPRIARVVAPGIPHHVTQRGNRRMEVFFSDDNRQEHLRLPPMGDGAFVERSERTLQRVLKLRNGGTQEGERGETGCTGVWMCVLGKTTAV